MREILILNTGGTIGMAPGPQGLAPRPGLIEAAVARLAPGLPVRVESWDPLRDSADIGPADWNRMADAVAASTARAVVVIHGTDTMAHTGAALAAMGASAGRAVLLCGAMQPLNTGGDAEGNLALALRAAAEVAPGVWLAFAGEVLPAAGLVKHHSQAAAAFRAVLGPQPAPRPRRFDPARRLAVVTLSPGLPPAALSALLAGLDGAVLRVFGAGTAPGDPALIAALAGAVARGCRLRAVSQCEAGGLSPGAYAAGAALWSAGVETGGGETPEAALARLWLDMSETDA